MSTPTPAAPAVTVASTDESEKAMVYTERNLTANVLTCCYAAL
ncbi:hypothetical protein [Streptomyces sp. NPDC058623]